MTTGYQPKYHLLPAHLQGGAKRYIEDHIIPGGFLTAVLENDLKEAILRADEISLAALPQIVLFFYGEAPMNCWGSKAKVTSWIAGYPE